MKGETFIIKAMDSKNAKLEKLKNWKPRKGTIIGDPEDLVNFKAWVQTRNGET